MKMKKTCTLIFLVLLASQTLAFHPFLLLSNLSHKLMRSKKEPIKTDAGITAESHFASIVKKHKGKCARNALFIALPISSMIISGPHPLNVLMLYLKIKAIMKHCTMYIFFKFANDRCARRVRVSLANLGDNYQDLKDLELQHKYSGIKQLFTVFLGDLEAVMIDCLPAGAVVPKEEDLPDAKTVFETDIDKFDLLQKTEDFWGIESTNIEAGD